MKAAENVDWESIRSKYQDILVRMKDQMPFNQEEAKQLGKDYPHKKKDIEKQTVTTKLKAIRMKYRQAIDSGRRSGHGRVVLLYFEVCEKIWGGSPATDKMQGGIETTDLGDTSAIQHECDIPIPQNSEADIEQDAEPSTSTIVQQRRALLDNRLSQYKQAKLKRKLPLDVQLLGCAREELEVKKRLVEQLDQMDKQHTEQVEKLSDNMDKLTNSLADGFNLLKQLLQPQIFSHQPMFPTNDVQWPPTDVSSNL